MKAFFVIVLLVLLSVSVGFSQAQTSREFCAEGRMTIGDDGMSFYDYRSSIGDSLGFVDLSPTHIKVVSKFGIKELCYLDQQPVMVWGRFQVKDSVIVGIDTMVVVMDDPSLATDPFLSWRLFVGKLWENKPFNYFLVGFDKLQYSRHQIRGFSSETLTSDIKVLGADSLEQLFGQEVMMSGIMQYIPDYGSQMGFLGNFGSWVIKKVFVGRRESEFPLMRRK